MVHSHLTRNRACCGASPRRRGAGWPAGLLSGGRATTLGVLALTDVVALLRGDMVKSELVKRIATRRPLLLERQVEKVMNVLLTEIAVALMSGDRVELRGLGIFSVRRRQPRMARTPQTGAPVRVSPRHLPTFKAGRQLHGRLNQPAERTSRLDGVSSPCSRRSSRRCSTRQ